MLIFGVTLFYVFRFFKKPKTLNRDTCIFINRFVEKKANLEIKGAIKKMGEEGMKKEEKKEVLWKNEW